MKTNHYNSTKKKFKSVFKEIIKEYQTEDIDEAAFPAYAHTNPFIDYLFWQRIKVAYNISIEGNPERVLDFGCGSGIFSQLISMHADEVTSLDINLEPFRLINNSIEFSENIDFIQGNYKTMEWDQKPFDIIVALDVLEHIKDLKSVETFFSSVTHSDSIIIISGPTENIFYKIGRKLAGNRFTGSYHESDISSVMQSFDKYSTVNKKVLWPFLPLFEVHSIVKNCG